MMSTAMMATGDWRSARGSARFCREDCAPRDNA
jgi:hypothetical protein